MCYVLVVPGGVDLLPCDVVGEGAAGGGRPAVAPELPGGGERAGLGVVAHPLQRAELQLGRGAQPLGAPQRGPDIGS